MGVLELSSLDAAATDMKTSNTRTDNSSDLQLTHRKGKAVLLVTRSHCVFLSSRYSESPTTDNILQCSQLQTLEDLTVK